nr:TetR/AcrR family transcriptional regulator [Fusibacter paucivorans]
MIQLLNEKEYEKITISELVNCVKMNRTTFYLFYSSKEALVQDICDIFFTEHFRKFARANLTHDEVYKEKVFLETSRELLAQKKAIRRLMAIRTERFDGYSQMETALEQMIMNLFLENNIRIKNSGPLDLFAKLYAAYIMASVKWFVEEGEHYEINTLFEMVKAYKRHGMYVLLET